MLSKKEVDAIERRYPYGGADPVARYDVLALIADLRERDFAQDRLRTIKRSLHTTLGMAEDVMDYDLIQAVNAVIRGRDSARGDLAEERDRLREALEKAKEGG